MLYIRTDMNETIATGHVMRCLSIADAAREQGEDVTFILADEQAVELLKNHGYEYAVLHTKWDEMEKEIPALRQIINEKGIDQLLVDSYQVTRDYFRTLRQFVKIVYLDDLNAFRYSVDAIICYANYWQKFCYSDNYKNIKLYLGMKYVPLRKVFWNSQKKNIRERTENLLLLSGGSDPYDVMGQILARIDRKKYHQINVICGAYNIRYEMLCECYKQEKNVHICKAVTNIEVYMQMADIAVSAGGTTLYELCACGTPTISYAFADNQLDNVKKFQEDGVIDYAGDVRKADVVSRVVEYLGQYYYAPKSRQARSDKMQQLVDGGGATRIVEALCENKKR